MLTDNQKRLIELDKKKTEVKKFFDEYAEAVLAVVTESGIGTYFQDDEGTVYKTYVPEGKFVHFEKFGVQRTRRQDEKRGDLSLKEAREAGFTVEGK